ncbi:hypothetical protein ABZ729_20225 [Streptomyces sp. NPDC006678]|uniref:hypothetical protein n=1 Tax=Streptomyces sp. NPDC006678 TaxID=3157185 RepID=UPI0033D4674C
MALSVLAILGVAAAMVLALVLARPARRRNTGGIRRRLARPRLKPLSNIEREQLISQWTVIKAQFVDAPAVATTRADELLGRLATARGLPSASYEHRLRALSALFPAEASGARRLHTASERAATGDADVESMRRAMIAGRRAFEALVMAGPHNHGPDAATHRTIVLARRVPPQRSAPLLP